MTTNKRFKIYDKETLNTYIEDTLEYYSDGTPKSYWFGENEDFCDLFDKLNELADENNELKQFKEKVFSWIDKEIARNEEAIEWGKETGASTGAIGFYSHMLKRLKKELQE